MWINVRLTIVSIYDIICYNTNMKSNIPQNNFPAGQWPDDGIRIISQCPVCHTSYNPMIGKVLDESEGAHLLFIKCGKCQLSTLALVVASNFGVSSMGLITELDSNEVLKFKDHEAINAGQLLEFHQNLSNFNINSLF